MWEKLRAIVQYLRDPNTSRFYMPPRQLDNEGRATYLRMSPAALEELLIAVVKAKDHRGCMVKLKPEDVLQPWVMRQIPEPMEMHASFVPAGVPADEC